MGSPLNSPTNMPPSPASEGDDDKFNLNIDEAVDDADIHSGGRGGVALELEHRNSNTDILKKQINDKQLLIEDLQTNLRELSGNRRRELLHFQQQIEAMKSRCREWYEQLMERVKEMEQIYQDKI